DADPEAVRLLTVRCARLPLALRVVGELVAARPAVPLSDLAGELADKQDRLDLLDAGGGPRTPGGTPFSSAYVDPCAAPGRLFRLLGRQPGVEVDAYDVAAMMAGVTVKQACHLLDLLAGAYLIQPVGPGRYGMHDLLRAYAAGQAACQDSGAYLRAAMTSLTD